MCLVFVRSSLRMPSLSSMRHYRVDLFALQICKFDPLFYPFFLLEYGYHPGSCSHQTYGNVYANVNATTPVINPWLPPLPAPYQRQPLPWPSSLTHHGMGSTPASRPSPSSPRSPSGTRRGFGGVLNRRYGSAQYHGAAVPQSTFTITLVIIHYCQRSKYSLQTIMIH